MFILNKILVVIVAVGFLAACGNEENDDMGSFGDNTSDKVAGNDQTAGNGDTAADNSSKEEGPNYINPGDTIKFNKISMEEYKSFNE